ncbi:MAG: hypothetical protein NTY20_02710 [Candidatus Aenigmarchaeota archaeon]|nr:hypothetical protein [Candidatus Aenigmarchaeota archaeon]
MNEIALLGDSDDQFLTDLFNMLKSKGYPVLILKFAEEEMPMKYKYRVLVDRASYCDFFLKVMVKNYSLKGTYVINNPFTNICDDKITEFNICQKLGIPYPKTIVLPKTNTEMDTRDQVNLPNLDSALSRMRFPIIMKPHDGYAWDNVNTANNLDEAKRIYDRQKDRMILLAQEIINPKTYYRVYYFRKREPVFIRYLPSERRYVTSDYSDIRTVMQIIRDYNIRLNTALDYDFNACEWAIDGNDNVFLIDAFNETPELDPNVIPKEYYSLILERFFSVIEEKFHSNELNKWPFEYSP